MKIKIIENLMLAFYIALLPVCLYLTIHSSIHRELVESSSILIATALVLIYSNFNSRLIFFIGYILVNRFIVSDSLYIAAYDMSAVALLLYYTEFRFSKQILDNIIISLSIIEFSFGVYYYLTGNFMADGRIGGFFPSSMHYAFVTIGLAFANYLSQTGIRRFFILFLLIASAYFSGSRAAFVGVAVTVFLIVLDNFGIKKTVLFSIIVLMLIFKYVGEIRAISYVAASDNTRLNTYVDWLTRLNLHDIFYGKGRYFLGSIGVTNNGLKAIVTESSILTYIEAYGFVGASVFLVAPFIKILKFSFSIKILIIAGAFLFIAMISPFFETPSILLTNVIIINSALYYYQYREKQI